MNIIIFQTLQSRGLIKDYTSNLPDKSCIYIGMDATMPSVHLGYLLQFNILRFLKKYNHKIIIIIGTGTTMIGDPTWKTKARPMLSREQIQKNADSIANQVKNLIQADHILYNHEWLEEKNIIEFMRDIGAYFSVNQLVKMDTFRTRLDSNNNLSFLEMTYPLLQSYDFLHLYQNYKCNVQLGGSDQWGNIVQGVELIRKIENASVCGITSPLLTTSDGVKMGKTDNGAIFLDKTLTSVYDFWQYLRNIDDKDVKKCLLQLTDIDQKEINAINVNNVDEINNAKILLANNLTAWVHGDKEAMAAHQKAQAIFQENHYEASYTIESAQNIVKVLCQIGVSNSNSEAKRYIQNKAVKIDNNFIEHNYIFQPGEYILIFAKKRKFKIIVE